ncbi:sugar ABC transporter substrate-binding protein [Actinocorallia sp. A-T 12471]|uniref:sugar ABC transporter substrate-binding protein n=1 Tax=Actinocorallia sp. A-T 12471 TaxID=3089813 RepID=UPI0029CD4DE7|nr:sugar ABC transporter substrate-binding protein [Actinocorallia sp. A-T 12471]MDX6742412.1 sugar ABC transporter substrate-binding protein [Actinocorallia sp. A-T 12471]
MIPSIQRTLAGLATTGLLVCLAACGDSSDDGTASAPPRADDGVGCAAAEGKTVGFSEPLPDPNFQAIETIVAKALKEYGAELKPVNANLDPGKQISDITALLQQGVSALIANPVDPNATQGVFAQARAKNVPVIVLDTKVGGPYFTMVHDDVETAATEGARILKEKVGDGKVGAILGPSFAELLTWEKEAFLAEAEKIGLNVVDQQVNQKITPDGAKAITDAWKQKYGADLKGVWTFNDVSAIGAASSLSGDFAPAIVSINGQPDAIPLVKAGKITTTFGVPYDKTGQALAYAALRALCGAEIAKEIVVPTVKLDKDNVDSWQPISARVDNPFKIELEERDGRTHVKLD